MKANEGKILKFLDGTDKRFIIPVYQRPYSWKKANCEILFKDLMNVYECNYESHFFGSIVYVEEEVGGTNEYLIIDGQQRLTTISILLLAIRNFIVNNKIECNINTSKITKAYLTDEYASDTKKLKLKLIQGDDVAYNQLVKNKDMIQSNDVTVNYNYFYNEIEDLSLEELEGLYSAIGKLIIVNISLKPSAGDDPQLIFESLNSTGKDLEESDKIRNYILMKQSSEEQEELYKDYWEVIENKVVSKGINKFIRYYLAVKRRELPNEKKLYFIFKNYRLSQECTIKEILADMVKYADYYKCIIESDEDGKGFERVIARLNKLDVSTVTPLLFDLFYAKDNQLLTENEFLEALLLVENYIVRRIICLLPANALNKVFIQIGQEVEKYTSSGEVSYIDALKYSLLSKAGKARFPSDNEFSEKFTLYELYNAAPTVRKFIFERLENASSKEKIAVDKQLESHELTIEHVMPQSLTKEWKGALGDNWELIYSKYIDTIGNLTLTAYNSEYSNLPFEKKKALPEKGFNYSKLTLNEYIKSCSSWGEKQIVERAGLLFQIAKKLWEMPDTSFSPETTIEWVYLDDDDYDYTNKIIRKFSFMGETVVTTDITDAFRKISDLLYSLDPVNFVKADKTKIGVESTSFSSTHKLAESVFLSTNLSSSQKISFLRKALKKLGLDFEELKFIVEDKPTAVVFDVNNPETYDVLKVGKLCIELFTNLVRNNLIGSDEIQLLLDKGYTAKTFRGTTYPFLATDRDAYMSASGTKRYAKTPVSIHGCEYYITTQWFKEGREDLIKWYLSHFE